ncbi:hypothetical protein SASPL_137485 [Salvia splendens]|uniref:Uncharacterized protein n=1 Tax=Salvia splendens TaxID=180675 RepID=A0A8X8WUY2_SALSN|nr:hypothetical protein SASPL_137485 [Salvia splendens]
MDHMDEIDIIDCDSIEITPLEESQIGSPESLMDEETMFAFVGLTLEKSSDATVDGMNYGPIVDEVMDIPVDDRIPNEENVFYDMDDPLMDVGIIYTNMNDFRKAVKQHAIKTQFELGTEKFNPNLFRGFCKAESCPWSIVARSYLSVDATTLNGRWNGQLASATALDGHNWIFPLAFGLFESETNEEWIWFMEQLRRATGSPPHLAICSDACKGLENAVKAVTFCPIYHEKLMHKMYEANDKVQPFLETYHSLLWMRYKFSEDIKCEYITNNIAEAWNNRVKYLMDLPIAELVDSLRSKFMELYARRRDIGERLEGHTMLPVVVRHLNVLSRQLSNLKVKV